MQDSDGNILRNEGITFKKAVHIFLPVLLVFSLFLVSIFQFLLPELEDIFIGRKREMIKELTTTVISEIANFEREARSGMYTLEQAQNLAAEHVRTMRYGEEGKDYFWINDMYPRMIMHPFTPVLENQSLREYADPNGKKLFVEMVDSVAYNGCGYVDYMWQWKDDSTRVVPKLSYVQGFEAWGWIVGTGVYIEDVYQELSILRNSLMLVSFIIMGLVCAPIAVTVRHSLQQEQKQRDIKKQLIESENKYRTIVENAGTAVLISENDKQISFVNKEFEMLTGWNRNELIGKYWTEIFSSEEIYKMSEYHRLRRINPDSVPKRYESRLRSSEGEEITVMLAVAIIPGTTRSIVSMLDISEKKRAEEEKLLLEDQLLQAQKMESIGRLAGGIAHDFNNILTSIMGYAELLHIKLSDSEHDKEAAGVILRGTERAADLTKQLLGFARAGKYNPVPVNVNQLITEAVEVSEKIFEKKIKVHYRFEDYINAIEADKGQFNQILTNLIFNAKDAMPEGGDITFTTANVFLSDENGEGIAGLEPGEYVSITVEDTGIGMSSKVSEKIFEPFYTTKGEGKGTGLGLATVYGIVKNHDGHISVDSVLEEGTKFTLLFPASGSEGEEQKEESPHIKGNALILVIDDEEQVRKLSANMLKELGYRTILAGSGTEAVEIFKERAEEIDLVLLDLIMPDMDGQQTNRELKKINPDIKVIVASGYARDGKAIEIMSEGPLNFIQKPYRLGMLSEIVASTLNKHTAQ